jgi:hypothetical protein
VQAETTRCGGKEHREIRFIYDERDVAVAQMAPGILSWLESQVLQGARFQPGESIQIGWMYDEFFARPDGTLGIVEPDFETVPVAWVDSLTLTLRHLWYQKEVAASLGLEPDFPSYRQSAVVCTELRNAATVFMHREAQAGWDSGWFIGCNAENHDHQDPSQLTRVSLFEAAVTWNARFIQYVALPEGCYVDEAEGGLRIARGKEWLSFAPGSYLATRAT